MTQTKLPKVYRYFNPRAREGPDLSKKGIKSLLKAVDYLNDEAKNALSDVVLKNQRVEVALRRTIEAYEASGYVKSDHNTFLISFDARINGNAELKAELSNTIQTALEQTTRVGELVFHADSSDERATQIAKDFGISHGKADLVLAASEKANLSTEALIKMPLTDLLHLQNEADAPAPEASEASEPPEAKYIGIEKAKRIALADADIRDDQKIVFTEEVLSRNGGKPCYFLSFNTADVYYTYKIDAKTGAILERRFIPLAEAKKIAMDDAGVDEKVTFTEAVLIDGGIKTPHYRLAFENSKGRWFYRIDAVLGTILEKTHASLDVDTTRALDSRPRQGN